MEVQIRRAVPCPPIEDVTVVLSEEEVRDLTYSIRWYFERYRDTAPTSNPWEDSLSAMVIFARNLEEALQA